MTHRGEMLSAYLDGELTSGEELRLLEHLESCDVCAAELAQLHEARSLLRSLPTLEVPRGLIPAAERTEGNVVPFRRRPRVWVATAAAVLVFLIGLATVLAPTPGAIEVPLDDLSNQFRARESLERTFDPIDIVPVVVEGTE